MGFLYCPSCGKEISELAVISACPNCYHPFDATVWRETEKQKREAEKQYLAQRELKRKKEEEQKRIWKGQGRCPECGGILSWIRESEYNECMMMSFRYERQYCETPSCIHGKYERRIPVNSREI